MKKLILALSVITATTLQAQTQIIAHRGFWKTDPATAENSLKALQNAADLKIYGSEFDVQMTSDGVLVINHDEHINQLEIAAEPFKKIRKEKLNNGETIPTLESYLKLGSTFPDLKLIVELKPAKTPELEREIVKKTVAQIRKMKLEKQCEYISFSLFICKELKKAAPEAKVQYLNGDLSPQEIKNLGIDGIDYHYKIFTEKHPEWLPEAKKLGLITNSWTVNDLAVYKQLKEAGLDFITTNTPDHFKNN